MIQVQSVVAENDRYLFVIILKKSYLSLHIMCFSKDSDMLDDFRVVQIVHGTLRVGLGLETCIE